MDLESIQITLNSKYASQYINGSHSSCTFYLPVIEIPVQHHIYLSVQNANIPYSFYNINSSNNSKHKPLISSKDLNNKIS